MNKAEYIRFKTFDGRLKTLAKVDDQHLSNIVHYAENIGVSGFYLMYKREIESLIQQRLGGIKLPYRPPVQHIDEIQRLESQGMLQVVNGKVLIKKNGVIIGEVVGPKSKQT